MSTPVFIVVLICLIVSSSGIGILLGAAATGKEILTTNERKKTMKKIDMSNIYKTYCKDANNCCFVCQMADSCKGEESLKGGNEFGYITTEGTIEIAS